MTYDPSIFNQRLTEQLIFVTGEQAVLVANDEVTIVIPSDRLIEIMRQLRDRVELGFDILIDVCGVDYLGYGASNWATDRSTSGFSRAATSHSPAYIDESTAERDSGRFAVVYHLLSTTHNWRLRVKCFVLDNEFPVVDSVVPLWPTANWFEREAFDMFGVRFEGHPDLRRILTDYGFQGHPFRKDFPLSGHVEMVYDEDQARVKYQPIDLEERVLVPRVIRQPGEAVSVRHLINPADGE